MPSAKNSAGKRIFAEICSMAIENGAVNLGQGYPDFGPPEHVLEALSNVARSDNPLLHQYCRVFGHIPLVEALGTLYSRVYDRKVNPLTEILVPIGGYGGLVCAIESVVKPGDEVLIFEPFFDCYKEMVETVGGIPIFIPLHPPEPPDPLRQLDSDNWTFSEEYILSHIRPNTKAVLLNSPSNPLGKLFSKSELEIIRDVCIEFDLTCISDEVYEWIVFDERKHMKIAAMEGMWERTLTIGSAGKAFSATGWKLGWIIGPEDLMERCQKVFQRCYYRCPTPIQEAVARSLEIEIRNLDTSDSYFVTLSKDLQRKRDWVVKTLLEIGMKPVIPRAGYFLLVEISTFLKNRRPCHITDHEAEDLQFTKWAIKEKKFGAIPASLFFDSERQNIGQKYIRLCFAKKDSTLEAAIDILMNLGNHSTKHHPN
ncbi:hypothetical protein LOTGIDRAFT_213992 [Lottia gigantea]|uniref:Aminotransferase class I/classII large domain-containing protein n=1 Tax=Lottia gigantea TaxID=225164 RepID=V4AXQ8_LOTGI|nr:hypothetical protein LOTGIDRAFT_213992 [Lottia gigantea]ESO98371.1 hypothetical protein LOTGIDRAFT_213992 [Lottia gigantea]